MVNFLQSIAEGAEEQDAAAARKSYAIFRGNGHWCREVWPDAPHRALLPGRFWRWCRFITGAVFRTPRRLRCAPHAPGHGGAVGEATPPDD